MVAMIDERDYTVPEIAERLRVSQWTVYNWLKSGRLGGYRPGGTKAGWRIPASDLDRFIAERRGEQRG
jgi:excisionase family DNA binding protein